jgi:uncharacterized protein (UPF0276 family)
VSPTPGGVGLGLRWDFVDELIETGGGCGTDGSRLPPIDFFEVSPENYVRRGGRVAAALEWVAERFPLLTHGLSLSIGGMEALDSTYLGEVAAVVSRLGSPWHSDHLCFCDSGGRALHELLPVAFTRANVTRIADRIRRAQDSIRRPLAIENVSYYWHPGRADLSEPEFLSSVCQAADCGWLLDVNNAFVNASNFDLDVDAWMRAAPVDRVVQIHVAGHERFVVDDEGLGPAQANRGPGDPALMIVDTHGADVAEEVLALLQRVLARTGPVPVVLERDQNVPRLDALVAEVCRIRAIWQTVADHGEPAGAARSGGGSQE